MAKKDNYIYYNGEQLLLSEWTTMAMKAVDLEKSEGFVRKQVFRKKHKIGKQTIEYRDIPELKLTIVKK